MTIGSVANSGWSAGVPVTMRSTSVCKNGTFNSHSQNAAGSFQTAARSSTTRFKSPALPSMSSHGITVGVGNPATQRARSTASNFAGNDFGTASVGRSPSS